MLPRVVHVFCRCFRMFQCFHRVYHVLPMFFYTAYTHTYTHTHIHIITHTHTYTYVCSIPVCAYIYIYIYIYIYTYRVKTQGSPKTERASSNVKDGKFIFSLRFAVYSAFFSMLSYIIFLIMLCGRKMDVVRATLYLFLHISSS